MSPLPNEAHLTNRVWIIMLRRMCLQWPLKSTSLLSLMGAYVFALRSTKPPWLTLGLESREAEGFSRSSRLQAGVLL